MHLVDFKFFYFFYLYILILCRIKPIYKPMKAFQANLPLLMPEKLFKYFNIEEKRVCMS